MTTNNNNQKQAATLVVFFEGTANTLDPITTQIGIFANAVSAFEICSYRDVEDAIEEKKTLKIAFDGCGVTHGLSGALFAVGLDKQVNDVVEVIQQMVKCVGKNASIRVVALGLSRGGIACFKLGQQIASQFSTAEVSLSMLLFDPVAGNAVWTGFPYTAAFSQNLRNCHNLDRVIALYPYEPLPSIAMHAPTLSKYPSTTQVEEDVTLGCHQGSLYFTKARPRDEYDAASNLSFRRIYDYLESEGIRMNFANHIHQPSAKECLDICQRYLAKHKPTRRITHDKTCRNRTIIRRGSKNEKKCRWLNKHHEQLEQMVYGTTKNNNTEMLYQLDFQDGFILFCT